MQCSTYVFYGVHLLVNILSGRIYLIATELRTSNTGLLKMIVRVLTTCHTPRSPDATPHDFFLWGDVKDQVYVPPLPASIPELKVVTCYKQFGTNSIIVLMFVESQRVHI